MWDAGSLEGVRAFQTAYTVESASFCEERGRFAAGGDDMWVHLHDFATGAELEVNKGAPAGPLSRCRHGSWLADPHARAWGRTPSTSAWLCRRQLCGGGADRRCADGPPSGIS